MTDDRPPQLDYAPPRSAPRWTTRRWLIWIGLATLLWMLAVWGPPTFDRLRLLWVQRQCANFDFAQGTVIYDSNQSSAAGLLADAGNYVPLDDISIWPSHGVARREPPAWTSLKTLLFPSQGFWPPGPAAPKALVHRLRNRKGAERLVAVILSPESPNRPGSTTSFNNSSGHEIGIVSAIIRPGDWHAAPQWEGNGTFFRPGFERAKHVRVFAAALDPADPAHFTVDYEMDGQRGTIDGTFQDDGDVTYKIRSGPATGPTPGSAPRTSGSSP